MKVDASHQTDVDIVVVGAGHAGCEAAHVAARMGANTVMVTLHCDAIGRLSCNPAIGGLAKGQLVRELDALGGLMAQVTDAATIQFRKLNTRKGLAVQSSRAQVDIDVYPSEMQRRLAATDGLTIVEGEVVGLVISDGRMSGVRLADGSQINASSVILATGTFLGGKLFCGPEQGPGGRVEERAATALSADLIASGVKLTRLKTGTPPRLDGRTIDWDVLEAQPEIDPDGRFSFENTPRRLEQVTCHLAYTDETTHKIVRENLDRSPLFSGDIVGTGPRYCPSVEDKVARFPERDRHRLFVEPEGLNTHSVYINGLSTCLPKDVQREVVASIKGFEKAEIIRFGYAVEYDCVDPTSLDHALQHKSLPGLYLAGQVNGTSGYEEAAVQGFVAAVSAVRGEALVLARDQAYIGVLIDDIVTRGVGGEPYRMFTSRAEHRLLLREDNADRRLMAIGRSLGLINDDRWDRFTQKEAEIVRLAAQIKGTRINPTADVLSLMASLNMGKLTRPTTAEELLRRPEVTWAQISQLLDLADTPTSVSEQVTIDVKYAGYIALAKRRVEKAVKMESYKIAPNLDWDAVPALKTEVRQRLKKSHPATIGALSRTPGVTPAAVNVIIAYLQVQSR
jgi:tRNA uridine 5-carboxymethylaminomethyl modification enzyme